MENENTEDNMIEHQIAIDMDMFDDLMFFLEQNYPEKNLAEICVNFKVYSDVIAREIGLIIETSETDNGQPQVSA